jgi:uncharacterized membrane protein YecN with MAPEG domain
LLNINLTQNPAHQASLPAFVHNNVISGTPTGEAMISITYVIFIIYLSMQLIKTGWKLQITIGYGNNEKLQNYTGPTTRCGRCAPVTALLFFYLEHYGACSWIIRLAGITLIIDSIIHTNG